MPKRLSPKDYVIATGTQYSVREFIEKAAHAIGINIRWEGSGRKEVGIIDTCTVTDGGTMSSCYPGKVIVRIDPRYFRPSEVETLLGDPGKANSELGWVPEITLESMVEEMMQHDLGLAKSSALLKANGYDVAITHEF